MSSELKEGVALKEVTIKTLSDLPYGAKSILVSEQCGQMGMVPWARVETNQGLIVLVNLANVESVVLAEKVES